MKINSEQQQICKFISLTTQNSEKFDYEKNKIDFSLFEKEIKINNSILEYFVLCFLRDSHDDRNELFIITYDALKDGKIIDSIKSEYIV
jgi:hypothetical protein